ncbi:Uncharacterised protein [Flavonifractor plautii]|uniref:Uncharacterized protein n=1 Tax=Flavonifractor plautii TaxID=292800 RepID=A0A174IEX7_FLAPL|nr:Uncharacterised protein [Flavonifractor plautii]
MFCDPWAAYSGGAEAAGPIPGGPGGGAGRHPAGHLQMGGRRRGAGGGQAGGPEPPVSPPGRGAAGGRGGGGRRTAPARRTQVEKAAVAPAVGGAGRCMRRAGPKGEHPSKRPGRPAFGRRPGGRPDVAGGGAGSRRPGGGRHLLLAAPGRPRGGGAGVGPVGDGGGGRRAIHRPGRPGRPGL